MASADLDPKSLMLESLKGACVKDIPGLQAEGVWQFEFTAGHLTVECPWRVVSGGRIVLGSVDHQQQFGLPEPMDAVLRISELLQEKSVEGVEIDSLSSDLTIRFTGDVRLDVFNSSSGYEGWQYSDRQGLELIAVGGGRLLMCYGERRDWKTTYGD